MKVQHGTPQNRGWEWNAVIVSQNAKIGKPAGGFFAGLKERWGKLGFFSALSIFSLAAAEAAEAEAAEAEAAANEGKPHLRGVRGKEKVISWMESSLQLRGGGVLQTCRGFNRQVSCLISHPDFTVLPLLTSAAPRSITNLSQLYDQK